MLDLAKIERTFSVCKPAGGSVIPGRYVRGISIAEASSKATDAGGELGGHVFAETDESGEIVRVFHPIAVLPTNEAAVQLEAMFDRDRVAH